MNPIDAIIDVDISNLLQEGILTSRCGNDNVTAPHRTTLVPPTSIGDFEFDDDERSATYLERLHAMLDECPAHTAAWTQDGTAFAIFDTKTFEDTILPRHFQGIKFASFLRQLSSYRFKKTKLATGMMGMASILEFQHDSFLRYRPDLLSAIKRKYRIRPSRGQGVRPAVAPPRGDLRTAVMELTDYTRRLQEELAETKALLRAMEAEEDEEEIKTEPLEL
ncbi:Aste57867_21020 [Aphanomyces stellatus]|uniref:Aste57867_21020 protein n=1 Tax=Aphanomyces stellatus TaxID=120398 RepID=A0A485LH63_9STRA|nr:hypothetical protein As57867_020952 [Aphanomyces stellatus]VFT97695.1 Aste57867_21020 [Aphanomyces stellatus]